jgi:hypothetical protein
MADLSVYTELFTRTLTAAQWKQVHAIFKATPDYRLAKELEAHIFDQPTMAKIAVATGQQNSSMFMAYALSAWLYERTAQIKRNKG